MDKREQARVRKQRQRDREKGKSVTFRGSVTSHPVTVNVETAAKLLLICRACDKEVRGLDGKVNLLSLIRYGIEGPTLLSIKGQLEG